jgi:hypothetical protein
MIIGGVTPPIGELTKSLSIRRTENVVVFAWHNCQESYTRHLTLERKQANSGRVIDFTERKYIFEGGKKFRNS